MMPIIVIYLSAESQTFDFVAPKRFLNILAFWGLHICSADRNAGA